MDSKDIQPRPATYHYHRFLDEAGDTTFYGPHKKVIVGEQGISKAFILGMVTFKQPLQDIRNDILKLVSAVSNDAYFADIPSIKKKRTKGNFYFHATDDIPEVRKLFYDYINSIDCTFEAIVARKHPDIYENKHNGKEAEFYADLLSHLLNDKVQLGGKMVLNVASRGITTKNQNLQAAFVKAIRRNIKTGQDKSDLTNLVFTVQNHLQEPLLNIADYFCWAVQRVFERGEARYYNFLKEKISLVTDLYDWDSDNGNNTYYTPARPLTIENLLK